ncbi:MAG: DUF262 domain-containing protein [Clostridia bacterium]|nr:DUF262 domain-containing protein [Clostridia bacterium]
MKKDVLPLEEISIQDLFNGVEKSIYEVPVYQRNYAWEKDEILALVQDIYDSFQKKSEVYYIGTLVTYHRGDRVFEVIDGQQRLTTIRLILGVLGVSPKNRLTYKARKRSDDTISSIPTFDKDEMDVGILNGYKYAESAVNDLDLSKEGKTAFKNYFLNNVHIIHYRVPKDIDLNHYFEIMNSRGEQLEKHEIVKARLLSKLYKQEERSVFTAIWDSCSDMGVYVQQKFRDGTYIFGTALCDFRPNSFDEIHISFYEESEKKKTIYELFSGPSERVGMNEKQVERPDTFQPIIDFANFLLIVLKLTRMTEPDFSPESFNLDDKELINEFDKVDTHPDFVKEFAFNLLKAKYLLDNYIAHHSNEDDTIDNNPWKLERWQKSSDNKKGYPKNLFDDTYKQLKSVHLLSMFEVSFTARQRKNYLFYCLLYLFQNNLPDHDGYPDFLERLAEKYLCDVYLVPENLNAINTPLPGSFDSVVLKNNTLDINTHGNGSKERFNLVYGDGTEKTKGVPLFIFNYIDYKLWKKYSDELRGEDSKEGSRKRNSFFDCLGCSDFGLKVFDQFYFSRTRRSLEHYYPQALASGRDGRPNENEINCLGNFAMIGSEINSSGSDWTPKAKLTRYLDDSKKIKLVSVASLKFMIMMQMCKDNTESRDSGQEWIFEDIQIHQNNILDLLFA